MTESNKDNNDLPNEEKQHAPRARNRTVMLSSDVTGEMRSRLVDDFAAAAAKEKEEAAQGLPSGDSENLEANPSLENKAEALLNSPRQRQLTKEFMAPSFLSPETPKPAFSPKPSEGSPTADKGPEKVARVSSPPPSPAYGATPPDRSSAPSMRPVSQSTVEPKPQPTGRHLQHNASERRPIAGMHRNAPLPTPAAPQMAPVRPVSEPAVQDGTDHIVWVKPSAVRGFLISYDKDENGQIFELKNGRLIVTSEMSAGGSYLLLADESVSPMHAILKVGSGAELQVLDQLSENGTEIKSHETGDVQSLSGEKGVAKHGDILSFGDRTFYVCLVWRD